MNCPAAELRSIKMNFYLINPDAEHRGILLINPDAEHRGILLIKLNHNSQKTNYKQITMTKIQNPKQLAFDLI
jgi:hypothetical protein